MRKTKPRLIITEFARLMEVKLQQRDDKPPWRGQTLIRHLRGLQIEENELKEALLDTLESDDTRSSIQAVIDECCDVALYAMMIADHVGSICEHDGRGREWKQS